MPDLIHYAIPGFVLLLTAEVIFSAWDKRGLYETKDAASSIAMGLGNVFIGLLTKGVIYLIYTLIYQFRIFTLDASLWWVWVLCFFADDLSYYWFHRLSHNIRFFWASHVVHHSSQKYNLSTALRQNWTGNLTGTFAFWLWMPFLGFHPAMVMTMQAISLIYQFWIHTEAIHKLPRPIEFIFNTPSHHRVHHASDLKYLDKNHAGVLIIWDRMFGTFQPEQERPVFGLTRNIQTYNPLKIATHEWAEIGKDLRKARTWRDAWHYLFAPPGWSHDGSKKTTSQLKADAASTPPSPSPSI
ncbi:sterol desaturase family protein [Chitinophaga sp. SYP-B3965]|uniref:sterol desaturase family protein n=1 Tax=Chitinophaga sp. SYP-B3965 TaxID=2663120 RepID=UPI00129A03F7|nr:sterol desaturase family protein [Chitinophaga sp. SYP-B3965]MRG45583.1 sterol desaturase family protein [Chitinophaga sp. SYP-B3965]